MIHCCPQANFSISLLFTIPALRIHFDFDQSTSVASPIPIQTSVAASKFQTMKFNTRITTMIIIANSSNLMSQNQTTAINS